MSGSEESGTGAFNCPNCGAAAKPDSPTCLYCGSSIAVRICPSCFGNAAVDMKHCPHCGTAVANSHLKEKSALKCPLCECVMSLAKIGIYSLHECIRCSGLWVGKNCFQAICTGEEEQEAILRFRSEENSDGGGNPNKRKRAYIPCPECGKLMNHKNFSHCSGIVLDWCRDHGSWFDRQELHQIVIFIRNGGLRKAREKERRNLQIEKERLLMKEFNTAISSQRTGTYSGGISGFNRSGISILQFLQKTFLD